MSVLDGEVIKAVLEFVLADGVIIQNVLHFLATFLTTQTDADVLDACEQYGEDLYSEIDAYIDQNVSVNPMTVHVVVWDGVEGEWVTDRLVGLADPTIVFTGATDPLPNQNSAVLVGNTARPKSRGRKFMAPFVEVAATGSSWNPTVLVDLGLALAHYLADELVTAGNNLSPGVPRASADTFLEFSDGAVNSVVGSQRRRKPGIGA